jgi:hypothetical protein
VVKMTMGTCSSRDEHLDKIDVGPWQMEARQCRSLHGGDRAQRGRDPKRHRQDDTRREPPQYQLPRAPAGDDRSARLFDHSP